MVILMVVAVLGAVWLSSQQPKMALKPVKIKTRNNKHLR